MTVPLWQDSEAKSIVEEDRILRKRFYIFFVARDEAGQLRKISIPVQYLYVLLAGSGDRRPLPDRNRQFLYPDAAKGRPL